MIFTVSVRFGGIQVEGGLIKYLCRLKIMYVMVRGWGVAMKAVK